MADCPDLYETLEIRYPPPRARGDPGPPRPRCHSCGRALGTAVLLLLAAATAALGTLYFQSRAELRAARAELTAATDPLGPEPDGDSPAAAQQRQDRLGRWLQALGLGWRYHRGKLYLFSSQKLPWAAAEAACAVTHAHLATVTSADEQVYLARESHGGTFWIGLAATGPGGAWRWADGTPYDPESSFWAPGQPDGTDHGRWGGEGCAQLHPVGAALWNDHNCNFSFPWVCQRDLSVP